MRYAVRPALNNSTLLCVVFAEEVSLFYKTENGAAAGDLFHSLIHTCELGGVNAHDYLVALLSHAPLVQDAPKDWMPWNYTDTLRALHPAPPS